MPRGKKNPLEPEGNENEAQTSETSQAATTETAQVAETPKQPNVIWSSEKKEDDSLKYGNPPASVRIGIDSIEVPDADNQLKGFYSQHAARLVRNIPGYKYLKPKGEK